MAKSTPKGLKSGANLHAILDAPTPQEAMQSIFTSSVGKISGGEAKGVVKAALQDLDKRMAQQDKRAKDSPKKCIEDDSAKQKSVDFDGVSLIDLDVNLQCLDIFEQDGDESSAEGSGIVFGKSGKDYSLWLTLNLSSGDSHGYIANVNKETKKVDFLKIENAASNDRVSVYRVKAKPGSKDFELSWASTGSDYQLGCGFRIVSDGEYAKAEGLVGGGALSGASDCDGAESFDVCLKATDFTEASSGSCSDLSYTMKRIKLDAIWGKGSKLAKVLDITQFEGEITSIREDAEDSD